MALSSWAQPANGSTGPEAESTNPVIRPAYAGRVVRAFDFEEMFTNPLPVPKGWIRAQHDPDVPRDRPGFPIWNRAILDYNSPAQSGRGTVYLPVAGGSTSLILRHGELTVFPKADYLISVQIRTQGLTHSRARLLAVLIDQQGNEIERSQVSTGLIDTKGSWELASVFIEGTEPSAAFVRIELQVLQPEQQPRTLRLKPFTVWEQDFSGGAWFDDIVVAQVPMIGLSTGAVGNVVAGNVSPKLHMTIRDITGSGLTSTVKVFDSTGHLVDQYISSGGTQRLGEDWVPELPGFGWYHAIFDVVSDGSLVGREQLYFIWEPPHLWGSGSLSESLSESTPSALIESFSKRADPTESIFVLSSTRLEPKLLQALPEMATMTGVSTLNMKAWQVGSRAQDLSKGSDMVNAIDQVLGSGIDVSLTLGQIPMNLADKAAIDHDDIFGFLINHPAIALPVLGPFWDRYGQMVSEWQIGFDPNEDDLQTLSQNIDSIATMMDPYVPDAVIGIPWPIDRPFDLGVFDQTVRLVVADDPSYSENAFSDMIQQWASGNPDSLNEFSNDSRSRLSLVHHPYPTVDGQTESVWSRIGWLGRRSINAWWAAKTTSSYGQEIQVVLQDPWIVEEGRRGRVMPSPELLVWRTLTDHLGGRQAVQELKFADGLRMLLCSPRGGSSAETTSSDGALIVWLDQPSLDPVELQLPLSMGTVQVVDLFGNITPAPLSRETALNLPIHRIKVTRTPQIITGVHAPLVKFLANIKLSPENLKATSGVHKHELVVFNPWPFTIRGRIYIVEPGGYSEPGGKSVDRSWEIKPRVVNFSITAGLEKRFDLDISYSSAQLAGIKDLIFDVELLADQDYGLMRVYRTFELGTDDIHLDLAIRRAGPDKIEVQAIVMNKLQQPMMVDLVALAPKNSRKESTISDIQPSKQGQRVFLFDNLVSGDQVVISAKVPELGIQLNKAIRLP